MVQPLSGERRTSDEAVGGGPTDDGGQYGKQSVNISNQQKVRKFEFSRVVSGHNVLKGVSGASVSSKNGKPMHECKFEVTSASLALRVSISDGKKRVVKWLNPYPRHKSIDSGPVLLRLRLVCVKYFPENKYFSEMLFSGKENIFKCLVVF